MAAFHASETVRPVSSVRQRPLPTADSYCGGSADPRGVGRRPRPRGGAVAARIDDRRRLRARETAIPLAPPVESGGVCVYSWSDAHDHVDPDELFAQSTAVQKFVEDADGVYTRGDVGWPSAVVAAPSFQAIRRRAEEGVQPVVLLWKMGFPDNLSATRRAVAVLQSARATVFALYRSADSFVVVAGSWLVEQDDA